MWAAFSLLFILFLLGSFFAEREMIEKRHPNVCSLFSSECGSFRRVKIADGDRTSGVRKDNMGPPVVRFFRKTEQRFKRLRVFGIRGIRSLRILRGTLPPSRLFLCIEEHFVDGLDGPSASFLVPPAEFHQDNGH